MERLFRQSFYLTFVAYKPENSETKKQIRVVVNQLARAINKPPKTRDHLIVQFSLQILLSATAVAVAAVLATAVKWQGQIVAVAAMVIN
jgi:hypothetical protein